MRFGIFDSSVIVPLLRQGTFTARMTSDGVEVSNLADQPLLPWRVFEEAVLLLDRLGGEAAKGDAMSARLGAPKLPLNSIEGHVAHTVFQRPIGASVFRRITPIACILVWSDICHSLPGRLRLRHPRYS